MILCRMNVSPKQKQQSTESTPAWTGFHKISFCFIFTNKKKIKNLRINED